MNKYLEKFNQKLPKTVKYIEDNLTNLRCRRCGRPILKETNVEGYPYQCLNCDENMFSFETYEAADNFSEQELEELLGNAISVLGLDNEGQAVCISRKRLVGLLTECLTSIDEHCDEFDIKLNAIMSTGITCEELKALGFDYMACYIEDYMEKNKEEV